MIKLLQRMQGKLFPESKEVLASFFLSDLFKDAGYLPFTNSSLPLHSLLCIRNDISANNKNSILEFGCGISTVVIARMIAREGGKARITAFEENRGWFDFIRSVLERESLTNIARLIHAPLVKSERYEHALCYDPKIVGPALVNASFDLVLIDGPSAFRREIQNSRIPTYDLFKDHVNKDKCTIFIDNADRPGERLLSKLIVEELKARKKPITKTFTAHTIGNHFNFVL